MQHSFGGNIMSQFQVRTDLALETREKFEEDNVEIKGVRVEEECREESEIKITTMVIETENGAKAMGKPKGTYITLEAASLDSQDEDYHREVSVELARLIQRLLPEKKDPVSVLVAGLGNREVTPDALGPRVVDNMLITRHVLKEFGKYAFGEEEVHAVSGIEGLKMAVFLHGLNQRMHGVIYDGGCIHNCRHADGNYRNAYRLPGQPVPVISHAGTGIDSCIRNLYGAAEPAGNCHRRADSCGCSHHCK